MPPPSALHPRQESPIAPDQYLLIIGAMKCGTTSLFQYLAQHPEICAAHTKEPEFFSKYQGHRLALECYSELWSFDAERHRYALEASSGYSKFPQEAGVPKRIHEAGLRPRFLYVLRNPEQRIESHIRHIEEHDDQTSCWPFAAEYLLHLSNYYLQLERYLQYFESDQFLLLDFDQLMNAPATVMRSIESFASLSSYADYDFQPAHLSLERRSEQLDEAVAWRRRLRSLFGRQRYNAAAVSAKRKLQDHERAFIHHALEADMQRLQENFGFDVSAWGY